MASILEIRNAIKEIKKFHNKIIVLHCVSAYPTKLKDTNLNNIKKLKSLYKNCLVGVSDHTDDIFSSIAAIPFNIVAVEKHFKLNDKIKTTDSSFSITPEKLKKLKFNSVNLHKSLINKNKNIEKISKNLRRSIFAKTNIKKNDKLTKDNIETLRPFVGICASEYFKILGKNVKRSINKGTAIKKSFLF